MDNNDGAARLAQGEAERAAEYMLWKAYCLGAENAPKEPDRERFLQEFVSMIRHLAFTDVAYDRLMMLNALNRPLYHNFALPEYEFPTSLLEAPPI